MKMPLGYAMNVTVDLASHNYQPPYTVYLPSFES